MRCQSTSQLPHSQSGKREVSHGIVLYQKFAKLWNSSWGKSAIKRHKISKRLEQPALKF